MRNGETLKMHRKSINSAVGFNWSCQAGMRWKGRPQNVMERTNGRLLDCIRKALLHLWWASKSAPLDKRPSDLCSHPWVTWSSQHQSATNTIFEELNWKFVPLYLSKTLLSVTSPTLFFTRLCGSHSDALLVSRAFFTSWLLSELLVHILLGYSFRYWLILSKIHFYFVIFQNILRDGLTFSYWHSNSTLICCALSSFCSQKNSSISVQFLQNSNTLVEIWFFLPRQVGISNYTVS